MAIVKTQLSIRLLGTPEIQAAGGQVVINNHKARALLFYLAATAQPQTRDSLATLLWSETTDSNARHSLRSSLYRLRQALHSYHAENALIIDGNMVQLQPGEDACDVPTFYRLLTKGNESTLAEAVAMYHGTLLQGFTLPDAPVFEEWLRFEESKLRQAYSGALQRLAAFAGSRQSWDEAAEYMQRLVQLDPLDEAIQQQLIGLYLHMGAIGKALQQYRQLESELVEKLDLTLNDNAQAFRSLPREEAISRLKADSDKMLAIFDSLSADEWSNFLVTHPYMGPLPTFFYPAFHVMDYGVHTWDMNWGLGKKDEQLDERTAGVLVPYMFILMQYTVDQESAKGIDAVIGIQVDGEWGGKWKATIKDGTFTAAPSENLDDVQAVFHFKNASDFVLTTFQRFPEGETSGDPQVIDQVRHLFFRI